MSSLLSLIIGTVVGLTQFRIKRLLAYSTISHVGFILLALSITSIESIQAFVFYLMQYSISNLNAFIISPLIIAIIALLIPHDGHGIPVKPLIKQILPVISPNFFIKKNIIDSPNKTNINIFPNLIFLLLNLKYLFIKL